METLSSSKFAYKDMNVGSLKPSDTSAIRDIMQKGYFNIGDEKNRKLNSDTTYLTGIASDKKNIN